MIEDNEINVYQKIRDDFCKHDGTEERRICKALYTTGTVRYVKQCVNCGHLGSSIKKSEALETTTDEELPYADLALKKEKEAELNRLIYAEIDRRRQRTNSERNREFWDQHNRAINSIYWRIIRRKVLDRANELCEGCGTHKATEVHHLTYEHLGHELMFELVALCRDCHEFITEQRRSLGIGGAGR